MTSWRKKHIKHINKMLLPESLCIDSKTLSNSAGRIKLRTHLVYWWWWWKELSNTMDQNPPQCSVGLRSVDYRGHIISTFMKLFSDPSWPMEGGSVFLEEIPIGIEGLHRRIKGITQYWFAFTLPSEGMGRPKRCQNSDPYNRATLLPLCRGHTFL